MATLPFFLAVYWRFIGGLLPLSGAWIATLADSGRRRAGLQREETPVADKKKRPIASPPAARDVDIRRAGTVTAMVVDIPTSDMHAHTSTTKVDMIRRLLASGARVVDIAEATGVSRSRIYEIRKDWLASRPAP